MPETMKADVVWKARLQFEGRSAFAQTTLLDVGPPFSGGEGTSPMELLLMSLAACAGQTIVSLLQKKRQDLRSFSIRATGIKRDEHPRIFTGIDLEIEAAGPGLDPAAVETAVRMTEEKYCPVLAIIRHSVPVRTIVRIGPDSPAVR
jgi:putative redox protein